MKFIVALAMLCGAHAQQKGTIVEEGLYITIIINICFTQLHANFNNVEFSTWFGLL